MRILYLDIDTLRPDHLSCYGYHRQTSPNIDRIAAQGVRFDNCFVSDAPCLPSRTALTFGQFGIHNGVINHGGRAADPCNEGTGRSFRSMLGGFSWAMMLRKAGLRTVTISPFGERHSAWWWYAGFNEAHNFGKGGMERADEIAPAALDWIARHGRGDNWFLHVNFWDPHTAYRAPASFGEPFKDQPLPAWLTDDVRKQHWAGCGPHSAQEISGFAPNFRGEYPRQPAQADSMAAVRAMFDGYDTGILYADHYAGQLFNALAETGVLDDTIVIISSDHGENLGELNVYGDHQTADAITCRVPLIVRWPGVTQPGVDPALHYQIDWSATMVELLGQQVPGHWDGRSFADPFTKNARGAGRDRLVISQGAWSCQRSVVFRHDGQQHVCIRSYHDGYHGFPDVMLFNTDTDPHEQHDLAPQRPELVAHAMALLDEWHGQMMQPVKPVKAATPSDPIWTVLREGGPFHTRGELPKYLERLRATGRARWADALAAKHPAEC